MKDYILIISIHADAALAPGFRDWGGTNVYMRELMDGLNKLKIPFVFITRKVFKELPNTEEISENGTIYRITSGEEKLIDKNLLKNYHLQHLEQIKKIIDSLESKPSVIHSVYWNSGRLAIELAELYSVKFVHSVISNNLGRIARGAENFCEGRSEYEKEIFEKAYRILAVSKDEKEDLIRFYDIVPDKILVAGQEVNPSFLFPAHDANGFPRVYSKIPEIHQKAIATRENTLPQQNNTSNWWNYKAFTYMGRLSYNKGVPIIINAWYQLYRTYSNDCPSLWIIGGSIAEIEVLRHQLEIKELADLEKKQKIIWWGYLDEQGISTLLLKSLVLIMHSMYEPGGRVAVEAMSEGIPVIVTNRGFGADYVKNWENGFCVEYGDVSALRRRMELFVRQPLLADTLGKNAKQSAKNIIREWDFLYSHCNAYIDAGYPHEKFIHTKPYEFPSDNAFRKRWINVYPYVNDEPTKQLISSYANSIFRGVREISELKEHSSTSQLWKLTTNTECYILKYYQTRLSLNTIYNPFQKEIWVRRSDLLIKTEECFEKALKYNHIYKADYSYGFLIMKEYPLAEVKNPIQCIPIMLDMLNDLSKAVSPLQKNAFLSMPWSSNMEYDDIQTLIIQYREQFEYCYGIDASCMQSVFLAWHMLPYLIDYNLIYLDPQFVDLLKSTYIPCFQKLSLEELNMPVTYIHGDVKFEHIIVNKNKWEFIDNEKACIGRMGYDISTIMIRYHQEGYTWDTLLNLVPETSISRNLLICRIVYDLIYDELVNSVLENSKGTLLNDIKLLYDDIC